MKFTNDDEKKHHNGDRANRDQEYGNQLPEDVTRKYIHEIFKEATLGRAVGPGRRSDSRSLSDGGQYESLHGLNVDLKVFKSSRYASHLHVGYLDLI